MQKAPEEVVRREEEDAKGDRSGPLRIGTAELEKEREK